MIESGEDVDDLTEGACASCGTPFYLTRPNALFLDGRWYGEIVCTDCGGQPMSRLDEIKATMALPVTRPNRAEADWLIAEVDRLEAVNNGLLMARNSWRADAEQLGERVSVLTAENAAYRQLLEANGVDY